MQRLIRDRYEPLGTVGRGGQGHVIRALDRQHDRVVAIKVRPTGTQEQRAALLGEARILLDLRPHPNLPLVREDFFDGRHYYLVMDWAEGQNLQDALAERGVPGLPWEAVVHTVQMVAGALDHLHAHQPQIVHADVKPANVIVRSDGSAVLVDLGIAHRSSAVHMRAAGTSGYCPPEVASGDGPTIASDVYGLAATAVALLTGRTPDGVKPEWTGIPAAIVPGIERVLFRSLSVDPANRHESAGDLARELRAATGLTTSAVLVATRGLSFRRRVLAGATAIALLSAGLLGAGRIMDPSGSKGLPKAPDQVSLPAPATSVPDGNVVSPQAFPSAPPGTSNAGASLDASTRPTASGSAGPAPATKSGWRGPRMLFEMADGGKQQIFIAEGDGSAPRRLMNDAVSRSSTNYMARWSPDARQIVFVSDRSGEQDIFVVNADGSRLRRLSQAGPDVQPDWSPDGSKIVFVRWYDEGARLVVIEAQRGESGGVRRLTNGLYDWEVNPRWSPDGTKIAFVGRPALQRDIYVVAATASEGQATQLTSTLSLDTHPAWSPDSKNIAFISDRGGSHDLYVMGAQGESSAAAVAITKNVTAGMPDWSGDGSLIAFHHTTPSQTFAVVALPAGARGVSTFQRSLRAPASASFPDLIP